MQEITFRLSRQPKRCPAVGYIHFVREAKLGRTPRERELVDTSCITVSNQEGRPKQIFQQHVSLLRYDPCCCGDLSHTRFVLPQATYHNKSRFSHTTLLITQKSSWKSRSLPDIYNICGLQENLLGIPAIPMYGRLLGVFRVLYKSIYLHFLIFMIYCLYNK